MRLFYFIVSFYCYFYVSSKIFKQSYSLMKFNSHSFQFLLKHTLNIGQGTFKLKARFLSHINHPQPPSAIMLKLYFFTDVRWNKAKKLFSCYDKTQQANDYLLLPMPSKGDWTFPIELDLNQTKRPYIWLVFLTDCDKVLPQFTDQKNHLELEFEILSPGGTHLSYENEGKIPLNFVVLIGYFLLLMSLNLKGNFFHFLLSDSEDIFAKPPTYLLIFSAIFEILSLILETIHLIKLSIDGVGSYTINFFSLFSSIISQFILTLLCILLASGWTLTKKKNEWEIYIPLFSIILLLEIILVYVDKALLENNYNLHDYEGLCMGLVLGIRVFLWVNLIVLSGKLLLDLRQNIKNPLIQKFVKQFIFLSSLYVLGLPIVVVIANLGIPDYFKNKFTGVSNLALQFISIASFFIILMDKNSLYNKIRIKKKTSQNLPVFSKCE